MLTGSDLDPIFSALGYAISYVHDLTHENGIAAGLGGQFTLADVLNRPRQYYGSEIEMRRTK